MAYMIRRTPYWRNQYNLERAMNRFFETNYYHVVETWDTAAGILEEYLTFWRLPGPDREDTPPWEEFMARILPTSK